jgi:hypothetical protein
MLSVKPDALFGGSLALTPNPLMLIIDGLHPSRYIAIK